MEDPVAHARHRMELLHERVAQSAEPPEAAMEELFEDFSVILEELHQANEEQQSQFEELLQTRHLLDEERRRYLELFEYAPDAYLVTNRSGLITEANRAAESLLGVRQDFLIQKPITVFIQPEDHQTLHRLIQNPRFEEEVEIRVRPRHGDLVITSVHVSTIYNTRKEPVGLRWILRDITASKQVQADLKASEQRFRTIFQEAQVGMCLTGLEGRLVECNRAFEEFTGYSSEEISKRLFFELAAPPVQTTALENAIQDMIKEKLKFYRAEQSFHRKDGKTVWGRMTVSALRDPRQKPILLMFILENITIEKEAALELKELNRRLQESSEIERLRLAQELHDGPMQDLYGAVFTLNSGYYKPELANPTENIREVQDIIKGVASTLRSICGELRPPTLANLGVERAIRSHADRLQEQNPDLEIELKLEEDEQTLHPNIRLALFRVYQQAILNVILHARASKAVVELKIEEAAAVLRICDNGIGFQAPDKLVELAREGHYGLASIAERVQTMGGTVTIHSDPSQGTRIQARIPRS